MNTEFKLSNPEDAPAIDLQPLALDMNVLKCPLFTFPTRPIEGPFEQFEEATIG